jgi:hypothetical protein
MCTSPLRQQVLMSGKRVSEVSVTRSTSATDMALASLAIYGGMLQAIREFLDAHPLRLVCDTEDHQLCDPQIGGYYTATDSASLAIIMAGIAPIH